MHHEFEVCVEMYSEIPTCRGLWRHTGLVVTPHNSSMMSLFSTHFELTAGGSFAVSWGVLHASLLTRKCSHDTDSSLLPVMESWQL